MNRMKRFFGNLGVILLLIVGLVAWMMLPWTGVLAVAVIATLGLGIGAMYVRSMTIMLVEKGTLAERRRFATTCVQRIANASAPIGGP